MSFLSAKDLNCSGKHVIVRADLDVKINEEGNVVDDSRLKDLLPTLHVLFERGASKIALIGHLGRPEGSFSSNYSLSPLAQYFKNNVTLETSFIPYKPLESFSEIFSEYTQTSSKLVILENLRFYKEEEENATSLATELANFGECFVNESFAVSHREHASVNALPMLLKQKDPTSIAIGLHFEKEIENLKKVTENPLRPLVIIISGAKEDKLTFLPLLKEKADQVLIAGALPLFMPEDQADPKVTVARLIPDREDITIHSMEQFENVIATAGTVFVSGPVGKFEEEGHLQGTKRVFEAITNSSAIKIAGGGDTTTAIHVLKLESAFDWISTGGGASLEYVANGTLPGIKVFED